MENKDNIYNVLDISRYIINKSIEINSPVSNLKLQKLLYYIQVESLLKRGKPIFNENIVAWKFGATVIESYEEFKTYSSGKITKKIITKDFWDIDDNFKLTVISKNVDPYKKITSTTDRDLIDNIIKKYKDYNSIEMMLQMKNEYPYKNNYIPNQDNIIKINDIKEFLNQEE